MKLHLILPCIVAVASAAFGGEVQKISPADAAKRVAAGDAVLVDVREPAEWADSEVAKPAVLLPKSDFDGPKKEWTPFLEKNREKQIILYCASGNRAGIVAAKLAEKGHKVANAGGFSDWAEAGLPVRKAEDKPATTPVPGKK